MKRASAASTVALHRVLVTALLVTGLACAAERPYVWVQDLPPLPPAGPSGLIHPRDTIAVLVRDQPAMSGEFVIREDGGYIQPTLGNVAVADRPPGAVALEIQSRLENMIVRPQVSVSIVKTASVRVSVVGEVKTPGTYELTRDKTVMASLAAAGWLTDFASKDRIFVVRSTDKGMRVRFRAQALTAPEPASAQFQMRDGDVVVVE